MNLGQENTCEENQEEDNCDEVLDKKNGNYEVFLVEKKSGKQWEF